MATFTFKMTDKDIEKGIGSIKSRAASIRVDIHKLMVSICRNWVEDGAVNVAATRMTQLLNAVDAAHKQKLVIWCNKYCSFTLEKDDDGDQFFAYDGKRTKMSQVEWAAAKAETMFDLSPDAKPVPFNFEQKLRALLEQAKKRPSSKAATDEDDIPQELVASLEALLPAKE